MTIPNMDVDKYVLGIDLGTTSVKASIINIKNNHVESYSVKETQSQYQYTKGGSTRNKQDVSKIVSALNFCVSKLSKTFLCQVSSIGICGQMHGVVFWSNNVLKQAWVLVEKDKNFRFDVVSENVSGLYTWQDARCDQEFLAKLPVPKSHINIASGFGIPTIFWMDKNQPEKIKEYSCAGTIGDFVVAMLCDLVKPVMSEQNAAGWGYFNCKTNSWNKDLLKNSDFPLKFLPEVQSAGTLAGSLVENWHTIPSGTPIGVAMGDIQCSILSCIKSSKDAVLNLTTSAQITYIADNFEPGQGPPKRTMVEYYPYFNNTFIAVGASLNGGNSLATFVKMLQQWALDLGYSMPQSKVWEKVLSLAIEQTEMSDLYIRPTCMGERHNPQLFGQMGNITPDSLHLGTVFKALCNGVIDNLHSILPSSELHAAKVTRILGNGKGLTRNPIIQGHIEEVYKLPLEIIPGVETSTGAAMAMSNLLQSSMTNISKLSEESMSDAEA